MKTTTLIAATIVLLVAGLMCTPALAVNVALATEGARAVASSEYAHFSAATAIDGKWLGPSDAPDANRWHSALEKPHPHWVWAKFRKPAQISKVVIHRGDIVGYPVDFVGEYSPDGGLSFRTLFRVTDCRMTPETWIVERTFAPVIADNFRLRILRSSNERNPNYAQISELEVFGEWADSAAPSAEKRLKTLPDSALVATDLGQVTPKETPNEFQFRSKFLGISLSRTAPRMTAFCWDSLGAGKVDANLLKPGEDGGAGLALGSLFGMPDGPDSTIVTREGNLVRYETIHPDDSQSRLEIRIEEKAVSIAAAFSSPSARVARSPGGITFAFACDVTPVAPLANPSKASTAPLPCLLHAPDYGTLLVERTDAGGARLIGQSIRPQSRWNASLVPAKQPRSDGLYVLPAGTSSVAFKLSVTAVDSALPEVVRADARLRAMPRYSLNGFQYRPDIGMLSNNIVSDNCCFCMYEYADLAVFMPELPGGVRPMTMVKESLDRYLAGATGYGVGAEHIFLDAYPAYLIAAWDVIRVTGDMSLLAKWLPKLEQIGAKIEAQDRNGNGLPESVKTGVSGEIRCPTSNWWDQINFGHEDAYVSALAYRGFGCLADLERLAKKPDQAERFERDAEKIKAAYLPTFLNPETGVIAGWKDADGNLHDYWFVFVNGIAISYGLVPDEQANKIVDRIEAKMKEVGFDRFDLGLPGPLVPIPKRDYGIGALGSPQKDDGTDAFQVFENGGASACMSYFYIQALYRLGRRAEAERILWPMMKTFAAGGFQNGVGHGGEWTRWDGTPSGYEGMLTDAYYAQLALYNGHYGITFGPEGFRLEPWSPLKGRVLRLNLQYMGKDAGIVNSERPTSNVQR